jgi:hypothetical protein
MPTTEEDKKFIPVRRLSDGRRTLALFLHVEGRNRERNTEEASASRFALYINFVFDRLDSNKSNFFS